jgi:hypothetical protein
MKTIYEYESISKKAEREALFAMSADTLINAMCMQRDDDYSEDDRDEAEFEEAVNWVNETLYDLIVNRGWAPVNARKYARCLEHFDPKLDEEIALKRMAKISENAGGMDVTVLYVD